MISRGRVAPAFFYPKQSHLNNQQMQQTTAGAQTHIEKLQGNKELAKAIANNTYYSVEQFYKDAKRYIKATKEGRMCCTIDKVSASGMSRTLKFTAPEKYSGKWHYNNYFAFFKALGFTEADKHSHYFRVHGCGMDMVFHTNYTIIHRLHKLGLVTKKQCEILAQITPPVL